MAAATRNQGPRNDPDGLTIMVREQGTATVIEVYGEWDLAGLSPIQQTISRVLDDVPECILLDLSRLEFIDSSGLHATVELTKRSAAQNTRLVIMPGPWPVQRMFEITGLLERLPFIEDRPKGSGVPTSPTAQRGAAVSGVRLPPASGAGSRP